MTSRLARLASAALMGLFFLAAGALVSAPEARAGCKEFTSAKQADIKDAKVQEVVRVWRKLHGPFAALTGRQTGLAVLHADAGEVGEGGEKAPFKPTAHICPGAPPVVYVTWPMVEMIFGDEATYPEDFLAFVLGHELGHRMNDLNAEGGLLGSSERASHGTGYGVEELADKRAAFFAASAGYAMRTLANERTVASFLEIEIGVRSYRVENRQMMLMGTLRKFDAYEHLYELAVAMSMSGEREVAIRLLARADELITGEGVPLPEVKALRAIALMNGAASHAPWRESLMAIPTQELRCAPLFPSHTSLFEEPEAGSLRSAEDQRALFERAKARLELASELLDDAEKFGVNELVLSSARGCIAAYQGDAKAARKHLDRARKLAGPKAPASVTAALDANEAMRRVVAFVAKNPAPARSDVAAAKRWGKKVRALRKKVRANADAKILVKQLSSYPDLPEAERQAPSPGPTCGGGAPKPLDAPQIIEGPDELASCPDGWRLLHVLPPPDKTTSPMGVTTCVPKKPREDGARERYVRLRLPGAMEPPLEEIDMVIVMRDFPAASAPKRDDWACGCASVTSQGTSDVGDRAELLVCPARGMTTGVLMSTPDGRVERVVVYEDMSY